MNRDANYDRRGTPASSQIVWLEARVAELEAQVDRLRDAVYPIMRRCDEASSGLPSGHILDKPGAAVHIDVPLLADLRAALEETT